MPETVERSESEQNAVLLRMYALAQQHAEELVGSRYRDDLVHDLTLEWLEDLRAGDWDVSVEGSDDFVIGAILNRKSDDRRQRRRAMARDAVYLEFLKNALREWMSPEFQLEEKELRDFAEQIHDTLPRKCLRAHRMVRDDEMSYAEVGKRLRVSADRVHDYIKTVHRAFRRALPTVDITPSTSRRDPTPARAPRRPMKIRRNRRRRGVIRGRSVDSRRGAL
jgi:DNA-directed RNA polymerase specialized sigma24 family protein